MKRFDTLPMPADSTVSDAPAPWELQGRGYISVLRFAPGWLREHGGIPDSLRDRQRPSRHALMMFVDYESSPVGPYRELLFIPGRFDFAAGRCCFSISRIYVSTLNSVINGRRNWGIPKALAQFDVDYGSSGLDTVRVHRDGEPVAELRYRRYAPALPISTRLLPRSLMTLGQHYEGRCFYYTPEASGRAQPARLLHAWSDPRWFPQLGEARPVLTTHHPRFHMRFPRAEISTLA